MDSKIIVRARLHSSIRNSGPVSFAISVNCSTTVRAVKELLIQKAQKAPGAPEWNAPSSPSAFIMRLNDTVPLVNEDVLLSTVLLYPEMRKICAQEEEDDVEYVEESLGSSSDPSRAKSSEKRLMTQISLTILPCSSTVSLTMRSCSQTSRCVIFRKSLPPSQLFDNPPLPNEASLGGALVALNCCSTVSALLSESGRIFIWGQNMQTSGILDGDQLFPGEQVAAHQAPGMHSPLYEMLSLPMPVSFVSCGPSHCLIVTRDGSLWAWGSGTLGQLGFGESIQQQVGPWKVSLPGTVLDAACGDSHSLALLTESEDRPGSSLYAWGSNERGQLGIGSTEQIITWTPTLVPSLDKEGVFSIHAGPSSSAAISSNGRAFVWGSNKANLFGQAAVSNLFSPIHVPIPSDAPQRCIGLSISGEHCVVLTETGKAFASGKVSRFLPDSDPEAVSSTFLSLIPDGCSSDQVFLHAVAGEDCTVLIGDSGDPPSLRSSIYVLGSKQSWKLEGVVLSAAVPTSGGVLAFTA